MGPTASGKSDLGIELARALAEHGRQAEVVNADSMQVYRGMDIGTAKVPLDERQGIAHHVLDVFDVTHEASVVEYRDLALAAISEIEARDALPILVGGSGLYVQSVLDRWEFPGSDAQVRAELEAQLQSLGPFALHDRLAALDPAAAISILPGNGRRIVRALEVIEITGRPFTANLPRPGADRRFHGPVIGIDPGVEELDARIDSRVGAMWDQGLVFEVEHLAARGLAEARTASRAVGYAQALDVLAGRCDEAEARRTTAQATRKLARRQRSWFRRDSSVRWYEQPDLDSVLEQVLRETSVER